MYTDLYLLTVHPTGIFFFCLFSTIFHDEPYLTPFFFLRCFLLCPRTNCFLDYSSYRGAPVWIIAVSKVGSWTCRLVGDGGHCFDGAAEEATIRGPLPERPHSTSPVVLEDSTPTTETGGKSSSGFGREAAAEGLDLLGDEGGGGDVGVAEIADLLESLASGGQRVHVEGR